MRLFRMGCSLLGHRNGETTAINIVEFTINDLEADPVGHPFNLSQGIVFEMFMADRIVGIAIEHHRHIALLENPQSIVFENGGHLTHEFKRMFKDVETL